jgi:hypothetical protein
MHGERIMRIAVIAIFLMSGCAVVKQPALQPFAGAEDWMVRMPLEYEIGDSGKVISVPNGFVTDFASVPAALRPFFPKLGKYLQAAIVHDYLYWNQSCSKGQADRIFYYAMKESRVGTLDKLAFFQAVDKVGKKAWKDNEQDKKRGLVKIVPANLLDVDPSLTWKVYQQVLKKKGISDADPYVDLRDQCQVISRYVD